MSSDYQQARLLVELAATVAYHSDPLLRGTAAISKKGIENYWLASRNRSEAWSQELKRLEVTARRGRQTRSQEEVTDLLWRDLLPLAEEILASEVLTRVWAAVGAAWDGRRGDEELVPFVRSIFVTHLDTRQRLFRLAFERSKLNHERVQTVDRLRRQTERWTDVLLGYLIHHVCVDEYAFEPDRADDFALSLRNPTAPPDTVKSLLVVSLRSTFSTGFTGACPNPEWNAAVSESVLSCFAPDVFDSIGLFRSVWEMRLRQAADDTLGMIDVLTADLRLS